MARHCYYIETVFLCIIFVECQNLVTGQDGLQLMSLLSTMTFSVLVNRPQLASSAL
ncbi:hypothetical protein ACJW31_03G150100 [Castanea mollissima]